MINQVAAEREEEIPDRALPRGGFAGLCPTEPGLRGDPGVSRSLRYYSGQFPKADSSPQDSADRDTGAPKGEMMSLDL